MSVVIELDEKLVAEIDKVAKGFNKNRLEYINEILQKSLQVKQTKSDYTKAEIHRMYSDAYGKNPVQSNEFEIEEEQLTEVWKDS